MTASRLPISPALRTLVARLARKAGSTATTFRGTVRAAIAFRRAHQRRVPGPLVRGETMPSRDLGRATAYAAAEATRKAHPEAKRARADGGFRASFLARLRREEKRLCAAPTTATLLAWSDARRGAKARLAEIALDREIATGRKAPAGAVATPILVPIDDAAADAVGWHTYRRCADRRVVASASPSRLEHTAAESKCSGGRWKTTVSAKARDYVRSVAVIDGDRAVLGWVLHETVGVTELPAGWWWEVDAEGLRAVREDGADHHVTAADLLAGADQIVAQAEAQAALRAEAAAQVEREAAQVAEVLVCVADARRAGNCAEGVRQWVETRGLPLAGHVPAPQILRLARNGVAERVRLSVRVAAERHEREVAQGFCVVADHRA